MTNIITESSTDTKSIRELVVPRVEEALSKPSNFNGYKNMLNEFISNRSEALYDTVPCSRLMCGDMEMDKIFPVIGMSKSEVKDAINKTYYGDISNFNPRAAKDEFTIAALCVIRYFYITKKDTKMADLACVHLIFSGKFYPSLHYKYYRKVVPKREVMEYVVNNELSKKYDLASQGSVIGAMRSIANTWLNTYKSKLDRLKDEDIKSLIDQLHSRINSFMKNISIIYYKVYEDKDRYMVYSSDSYDEDNYHLADSDALRMERYVEKTMNSISTNNVDFRFCKAASDSNIKATEIKSILESIFSDVSNRNTIREFIRLSIGTYFASSRSSKDVTDIAFITSAITPKPNSKQKEVIRSKEIIENWLCENSTAYIRRRSRIATKNSYERAIRMYFALLIHNTNK